MARIPISGIPSSFRAPLTAAEIVLAQGASTASAGIGEACYVGPKLSGGSAAANTVYPIGSEAEARALFGEGSPLHRALRLHLMANPQMKVWGLAHAASSGDGAAAATATIVYATNPTAPGVTRVTVCGEECSVAFTTADTPTTIGAKMAAAINAKTWLPLTAGASSGTVTLTARIAGASQGDGTVGVLRLRGSIDAGKGTTITVSGAALGLGSVTAGADGAVTEVAGLTAALAAIAARRFYYLGFTAWDATSLAAIKLHVATKSAPSPGLTCRAFSAYTHTLSALATIAIGVNYERHHIVWQKNSDHDTAELTAATLAVHQLEEATDRATNFDGYRTARWLIKPAFASADWPGLQDIDDAVTDGILPIASNASGSMIAMSVTTRSKNAAGTIDDFRACETHRVAVLDEFVDTWKLRHELTYSNKRLKADEVLPNGQINGNQRLPPKTVTPSTYRPFVVRTIDEFIERGLFQGQVDWVSGLAVVIDPNNPSRLECGVSGRTVDLLHQTTFRVAETTPG